MDCKGKKSMKSILVNIPFCWAGCSMLKSDCCCCKPSIWLCRFNNLRTGAHGHRRYQANFVWVKYIIGIIASIMFRHCQTDLFVCFHQNLSDWECCSPCSAALERVEKIKYECIHLSKDAKQKKNPEHLIYSINSTYEKDKLESMRT